SAAAGSPWTPLSPSSSLLGVSSDLALALPFGLICRRCRIINGQIHSVNKVTTSSFPNYHNVKRLIKPQTAFL
uniref:Uncharacterized protein n=1 Tax=Aegilops tauschii subsp. strangulata TaxID=200361 RepID=A0A453G0J8_AEGTS